MITPELIDFLIDAYRLPVKPVKDHKNLLDQLKVIFTMYMSMYHDRGDIMHIQSQFEELWKDYGHEFLALAVFSKYVAPDARNCRLH